ncbi:MAG: hypothetical protein B7Z08_06325 [Sphingomonadales bacterium 32-68-7]|nr:MAG: hypothetical protein B7Z33_12175 [Sphingomonadales bacterium 12-68-11]OYX09147.1 MAG: hypothetical protein B7Z08_06325 [Sphingomonadales bacterium 32-68-7]
MATAWTAIIAIVSVGWFVKLLGIESYGLIGFFATMQVAISVLDLGLGSTVNREVARGVAHGDLSRVGRVVRSLQLIYVMVALLIGAVVVACAPFIASHWLGASSIDQTEIEWSIRLMGVVAALRWPLGLYQGILIGLQRARKSYLVTATMATVSNIGAIILLYAIHPSLWTYFIWQVAAAVVTLYWMRRSARRELGPIIETAHDLRTLRGLLAQSLTISGVAVTGILWSQLDKIFVSGAVSLADFGRYSLATLIAGALTVLLIPTFNVIYPRMSGLVVAGKADELITFYRTGSKLLLCALIPISASSFFYAYDLLHVWTGDEVLAESTAPIVGLLIIGAAGNGVLNFPYALQLASGKERMALSINIGNLATAPIMFFLAARYGLMGGAIGWLLQASLYFVANVTLTHAFILKGLTTRWLLKDLTPGILAGVLLIGAGHALVVLLTDSSILRLVLASAIAVVVGVAIGLGRGDTRRVMLQLYRDWAGEQIRGRAAA